MAAETFRFLLRVAYILFICFGGLYFQFIQRHAYLVFNLVFQILAEQPDEWKFGMNNEDAGTEAPQFAGAGKCGDYGGHYDGVVEKDALYEVGGYEAGGVTSYLIHRAAAYFATTEVALAQRGANAIVEVEHDKYQHHEEGIPDGCKEVDDKQQEGCDSAG